MKGLTLVELLIVLVLIALVSGVAGNIIGIILRADSKTSVASQVQKNGDYVITQFSNTIRNAQSFIAVSTSSTPDCRIAPPDIKNTSCVYTDGDTTGALCNGGTTYSLVQFVALDGSTQGIACYGSLRVPTIINYQTNSTQSLVDSSLTVSSCSIYCSEQSSYLPPVIGISFTLSGQSGSFAEQQQLPQNFHTSVLMRN